MSTDKESGTNHQIDKHKNILVKQNSLNFSTKNIQAAIK